MAIGKKISDLSTVTTLAASSWIEVEVSSTSKKYDAYGFAQLSQSAIFTAVSSGVASSLSIKSTTPSFEWWETDGAVNNQRWRAYASGEQLVFDAISDSGISPVPWLQVDRTDTQIDIITLRANSVIIGTSAGSVPGLASYADDAAAAADGVAIGGLYRTASAVKIRVS